MTDTITAIDIEVNSSSIDAAVKSAKRLEDQIAKVQDQAIKSDAKRSSAVEKSAEKEIAAINKAYSQAVKADKKTTESAAALAEKEIAYINKVQGAAIEADKKITAAAVSAANKQASAAEKAAEREIAASAKAAEKIAAVTSRDHGAAIENNKKITASAVRESEKQAAAAEKASERKIIAADRVYNQAIAEDRRITASAVNAANRQAEAAERAANKEVSAYNRAHGAAIEADKKITASAEAQAAKQVAAAEKASLKEIAAFNRAHLAAIKSDQKITASAEKEAAKQIAAAENAVRREADAYNKAHGAAIEAQKRITASAQKEADKQVAAARKAADKEADAYNKAHGAAIEADKKRTASATKEAAKQVAAAQKAAQREIEAFDRAHDAAIKDDRARTASAVKEAKKQQAAAEAASRAMIRSSAATAKNIIGNFTAIGIAAAASMASIIINSAKSSNEMQVMAAQAAMTAEEFRALGFATELYGVSAIKAADNAKDLFDRLAEFERDGTGEFKDLGTSLQITDEELQKLAHTLSTMSSEDAFAEIVGQLDAAGISGAEMVQVMEAIANDSSRLIPLYRDQAKELKALTAEYEDMAKAYSLTAIESQEISDLNKQFSLLSKEAGLAADKITAAASPVLIKMFASLSDEIEEATGWISHFFKLMDDKSTESLVKDITDLEARLQDLTEATKGVGFKNWIYDAVASEESKAAIDAEIASLIKQIEEKEKLLGANNQLAKQAEKTKADKNATLKPSAPGADTGTTDKAVAAAQKEADQAFKIQQDLQTRSLALMQETEANKFAIAEASAAATSQIERNALDKDFAEKTISYSQYTLQAEMLEKELASKLAGIRGESTAALEQIYADDLALQSSYKDREIALMADSTEKVNMQHAQRLANLQANLDQGKIDYVQYLDEVAIENAETNAEIAATTAKAQAELVNELTSLTSNMLGAISREAEQAFNAIDDLFKILSNFDWFNGSGGVFGTVGGWMGLAAPDVSAPAPAASSAAPAAMLGREIIEMPAMPAINIPDAPSVSIPAINIPAAPAISMPEMPAMPGLSIPAIDIPNAQALSIPAIEVPAVSIPDMPAISIPAIDVPAAPNLSMPSVSMPDMPGITIPDMPSITIPATPSMPAAQTSYNSSVTNESNHVKSSANNSNRYNINVHINGVSDQGAIKSASESGVIAAIKSISQDSVSRSQMPGGIHNNGLGL